MSNEMSNEPTLDLYYQIFPPGMFGEASYQTLQALLEHGANGSSGLNYITAAPGQCDS